jgi:hypothetical protein
MSSNAPNGINANRKNMENQQDQGVQLSTITEMVRFHFSELKTSRCLISCFDVLSG